MSDTKVAEQVQCLGCQELRTRGTAICPYCSSQMFRPVLEPTGDNIDGMSGIKAALAELIERIRGEPPTGGEWLWHLQHEDRKSRTLILRRGLCPQVHGEALHSGEAEQFMLSHNRALSDIADLLQAIVDEVACCKRPSARLEKRRKKGASDENAGHDSM